MRLRTIIIEINDDAVDYNLADYLDGGIVIHNTEAQLISRSGKQYWYVLVSYTHLNAPLAKPMPAPRKKGEEPPTGYIQAVVDIIHAEKNLNIRTVNAVHDWNNLYDCESFKDLGKIKNLGRKSLQRDQEFLRKVLLVNRTFREKEQAAKLGGVSK